MKKASTLVLAFCIWCPEEDSVTSRDPGAASMRTPFDSSRKVRRDLAFWAHNAKGRRIRIGLS